MATISRGFGVLHAPTNSIAAVTVDEAALVLHNHLVRYPWFVGVSTGTPYNEAILHLEVTMVSEHILNEISGGLRGFNVMVRTSWRCDGGDAPC